MFNFCKRKFSKVKERKDSNDSLDEIIKKEIEENEETVLNKTGLPGADEISKMKFKVVYPTSKDTEETVSENIEDTTELIEDVYVDAEEDEVVELDICRPVRFKNSRFKVHNIKSKIEELVSDIQAQLYDNEKQITYLKALVRERDNQIEALDKESNTMREYLSTLRYENLDNKTKEDGVKSIVDLIEFSKVREELDLYKRFYSELSRAVKGDEF